MKTFYIIEINSYHPHLNIYEIEADNKDEAVEIYEGGYETNTSQWIILTEEEYKKVNFKTQKIKE